MPFSKDQAKQLTRDFNARAINKLKDALLAKDINTLYDKDAKLEMTQISDYFEKQLKDAKDKASFAAIMRLIDIHKKGETLSAVDRNILLSWAITNRDTDLQKVLVAYNADIDDDQDEEGNTALHLAVKAGNMAEVERLIRTLAADVNACNNKGDTPLHLAVKKDAIEMIVFLIAHKAQVNAKNNEGVTPLHVAVEEASIGVIRCLIKNEAKVEARDEKDNTPFHYAAKKGRIDVLGVLRHDYKADMFATNIYGSLPLHFAKTKSTAAIYLIKEAEQKGEFNINTVDKYERTLLHHAAEEGNLALVKFLVREKRANLKLKNAGGMTALSVAARNGHADVVKYLVSCGVDVNIRDEYACLALHYAAEKGDEESVRCLIQQHEREVKEKGASFDINTPDRYGKTALHGAVKSGNLALVKFLVQEKKADLNLKDGDGATALFLGALSGNPNVVRYLLECRADVNIQNQEGALPLFAAASKGDKEAVKCLIQQHEREAKEKGVPFDIDVRTLNGQTALYVAAQCGNLALVELLVKEKKANFNLKGFVGMTPLHAAARNGHADIVSYLVKCGADVNIRKDDDSLALHRAAEKGDQESVQCLIQQHEREAKEKGVSFNINAPGRYGETALHFAVKSGNLALVKFLVKQGANPHLKVLNKNTVLHLAAEKGDISMMKYLVNDCGLDMMARNIQFALPIHMAVSKGKKSAVAWLIRKGQLDINKLDDAKKEQPILHCAVQSGNLAMVKFLVKKGANLHLRDNLSFTALDLAAGNGQVLMVEYLVNECGMNPKGSEGYSPLHLAAGAGYQKTVEWLLQEGKMDIETRDSTNTVLHSAAERGKLALVKFLVEEKKAKLHAENGLGYMPLHAAARGNHLTIVEYLVKECKMDVNTQGSKYGETPLHSAAEGGCEEVIQFLVEQGANLNATQKNKRTPLHDAVVSEEETAVKFLLKAGAIVDLADEKGNTALSLAEMDSELHHLIKDFSPPSDGKVDTERNTNIAEILGELNKLSLAHPVNLSKPSLIKLVVESLKILVKAIDNISLGETEAGRIVRLDVSANNIVTALFSYECEVESRDYWSELKKKFQSLPKDLSDDQINAALEEVDSPCRLPRKEPLIPLASDASSSVADKIETKEREEKHALPPVQIEDEDEDLHLEIVESMRINDEPLSSVVESKEQRLEASSISVEVAPVVVPQKEEKTSTVKQVVAEPLPSFASGWWWDLELCAKLVLNEKREEKEEVSLAKLHGAFWLQGRGNEENLSISSSPANTSSG